jgi:hypothetical protein
MQQSGTQRIVTNLSVVGAKDFSPLLHTASLDMSNSDRNGAAVWVRRSGARRSATEGRGGEGGDQGLLICVLSIHFLNCTSVNP